MQRTVLLVPKYQVVYDALRKDIESGRLPAGGRVPSEADLGSRFGASRITVGRAVRDLQMQGLVERRIGSGTYVRRQASTAATDCTFGILVPDLPDIEIFEPLVQGLLSAPGARAHAFLWGGGESPATGRAAAAWARVQQYIAKRVDGVFFAPLEGLPAGDTTNLRIVSALDEARIPVVLLDRSVHPYPKRGPYDLVGIDNRRVGFAITEHLLNAGARRVAFLGTTNGASTIAGRRAGYREAIDVLQADGALTHLPVPSPADRAALAAYLDANEPDGIVCAHDRGAAQLMHALLALGRSIPGDIRLAGVDDVEYAAWLPVPLTTVRQPVREIGEAAVAAMLERRIHPGRPARDIFVQCTLVVRQSCGEKAG
ncbi:Arabinose metabolism transcriptional repressor [Luteitalea pratensis]|uniref:Arabinose metabolism transcriptional repressor n=1 Tax=Luteitalea pratensis TaxID=1855912 RepID=A0A143PPD2_LUTPR|nr:GntR family transcriptional regulator [Luteitalea pratensis]AMY10226.1 Arabinose metabolism transcriptional repressor [Luteitalea pratensis]